MSPETSDHRVETRVFLTQAVAGLFGFGVLFMLGVGGAGWLPRAWRLSIVAFAALGGAALLTRRRVAFGPREWLFLAGLAALVVWSALSAAWSDHATNSLLEAERTLVYVSGAAAFFVVVPRTGLRSFFTGAVLGITAVSAYGLADYLLSGRPIDPIEGRLLFEPIGYANGFGAFAAIALALALVLGTTAARNRQRLGAAACAVVLAIALSCTESRGAILAVAAGLAIALVFARAGARTRVAVSALAVAAIVAVNVIAIADQPTGSRLVGENRPRYWRIAWAEYEEHPVVGSGAGTFHVYWLRDREVESFTRVAHNLYLETLAQLGPLALAILVGTLALPLASRRVGNAPEIVAATAGYLTFLIHAAVDWDWQQPAVTLAGLFCGAALLAAARPGNAPELSPRGRAVLGAGAAALAMLALFRLATGHNVPFTS